MQDDPKTPYDGDNPCVFSGPTRPHKTLFQNHEARVRRGPSFPSLVLICFFALSSFSGAFYRPGSSAVDDVIVRGRLTTDDGRPIANEQVDLLLPASYGLSGSEAREPARYGAETSRSQVTTDSNGEFFLSFGTWVYHVDNFYIPVHIRVPKRAPALHFFMRVPRVSPEYYAIRAREGTYEVYEEQGGVLSEGPTPLASLVVREELEGEPRVTQISAIVELTYASTLASF